MIYLITSLSFFSALSFRAGAVFQVEVHGQDSLPGFRRTNDTITISAYTDSDVVQLIGLSSSLNLSCTNLTPGYRCTYTFPQNYQPSGAYTLHLRQQGGSPPEKRAKYIVDGEPPVVSRFLPSQLGSSVSVVYDVKDTAGSGVSGCSGLARLRLLVNERVVGEETLNGSCSKTGEISGEAPGLSGDAEIYLAVEDRLGNIGESTKVAKHLDTVPPGLPGSFQLLRNGVDIDKYSTDTDVDVRVTLAFDITEDALSSVIVNASSLTRTPQPGYASLTPRCTKDGNHFHCEVPNLRFNPALPDGDTTLAIHITATDASGNKVSGVAMKSVSVLNTKPTITYLGRPNHCDACFARDGLTEVVAELSAPGGMATNGLFFQASGAPVQATCNSTGGDAWSCTASVPFNGRGQVALKVLPNSMDDLGNKVAGTLEKTFTIDNEKPRILGTPSLDVACPVSGQTLTVSFDARDNLANKLFLTANTSSVTDRATTVATCDKSDDLFHCQIPIESFVSVHTTGKVPIIVEDEAGNSVKLMLNVEVCEPDTTTQPNYITELAPSGNLPIVDKRIASLIPFKVLLPLKLSLLGNARAIQVRSVRCTTPYISGPSYVMNEFSRSPLLVTNYYYTSVWPNGTVPLNCTLDFTIRRGNVVYVKPETETLNLQLPLVGQEIGNPGEAVKVKEQGLVTEINKLQEKIKKKAKLDNNLGQICQLAEKLEIANQALQALKMILFGIASTFSWGGAAAFWAKVNEALSGFHAFVNNYVWPEGWLPTPRNHIGLAVKTLCGLYTCKLYDAGTWAGFIMEEGVAHNWFGIGSWVTPTPKNGDIAIGEDGNKYVFDGKNWHSSNGEVVPYGAKDLLPVRGGKPLIAYQSSGESVYVYDQRSFKNIFSQWDMTRINNKLQSGNMIKLTYEDMLAGVKQSIQGDNWIVNPFRSTRYDSLCIPAQLYNLRKEKQLKCIELKCIREMATTGLPITQCEEKYAAQACLYLESAQARMHGGINNILKEAVTQIAIQLIMGVGQLWWFYDVCHPVYVDSIVKWNNLGSGLRAVTCGLTGAAMGWQELQSFMSAFGATTSTVPDGPDYCEGLDGVTPDDTAESGGGLL